MVREGRRAVLCVAIPAEYNGLLFDGDTFAELLREIHARPWEWEQTPL